MVRIRLPASKASLVGLPFKSGIETDPAKCSIDTTISLVELESQQITVLDVKSKDASFEGFAANQRLLPKLSEMFARRLHASLQRPSISEIDILSAHEHHLSPPLGDVRRRHQQRMHHL